MYIIFVFTLFAGVHAQFDTNMRDCKASSFNQTFSLPTTPIPLTGTNNTFFDLILGNSNGVWYWEQYFSDSTGPPDPNVTRHVNDTYANFKKYGPAKGSPIVLSVSADSKNFYILASSDCPNNNGNGCLFELPSRRPSCSFGSLGYCICSYTWTPANATDQTYQRCFPCTLSSNYYYDQKYKHSVDMTSASAEQINMAKLSIGPNGIHPPLDLSPWNYVM
ncbi:hypothetical protein BDK51DRAFT_49727 [Blyttiomyces helicus]|uniref:Uncharacterized protein n=1 Tax=Blyttiomyces helicus TaxID=388810 RepID=A0A4V1ISP4_9FUNG|nr:hypothetical protein BDK51DRAFT_49727 [Blyttiomyces helicus]|eukprot:RKO94267.1 hypothetical protein BDK51DRAFT_49727 [Blyttiomyces helicus]